MPEIDIQVRDKRYYRHKLKLKTFCRQIVQSAWLADEPSEISLVLANDDFVHILNRDYRGKDKPTNVLSFENADKPPQGQPWLAGDIIIAYQTVLKEAKEQDKTFCAHLAHLLIHGTLHLQGYDHLNARQAKKMESLETKIMKNLGYQDPYQNMEDL